MRLAIEPLDVLLFRDGRAFGAGADHRARTLLPPPPRTVHGALRTWLAYRAGWRPRAPLPPELGTSDDPGALRIRGPYLGRRTSEGVSTRHPVPEDRLALASGDGIRLVPPEPAPEWVVGDGPIAWHRPAPGEMPPEQQPVLEVSELLAVLTGRTDVIPGGRGGWGLGLAEPEPRVGIGLARPSRTVEEGLLYTVEFARLARDALLVVDAWLGEDDFPVGEGVLQLGGEGRSARFEQVPAFDWELGAVSEALRGARSVAIYLLTPAPFVSGSLPPGLAGGEGHLAGRRVRSSWAFVGRPVRIGGFDLARAGGVPRPSRYAVPPGAVWHVELLDGAADDAFVQTLHGQSLFPRGSAEERLGFGQVLLGVSRAGS